MDISKLIVELRENKKISPSDIADKIGIERTNYYRLEKRGEKLTIEQLKQIAGALGVELHELLGIEVQTVDLERVKELESRVSELEKWLKDKDKIISHIDGDCFSGYILLRDIEIQKAYAMGFEVMNENVYINGKLEEFAVDIYIKNDIDRKEVIKNHFATNPVIIWLVDFLSSNGYKTDSFVSYWKETLDQLKKPLIFDGFNLKPSSNSEK